MALVKIEISTKINSDLDKVWNYFNSAEHIIHWNFANDDWHCPKAEVDFKEGGKFKNNMAAKDGSMAFDFEGTYTNIIAKSHITYVLDDNRKVQIDFKELDGAVLVNEIFEAEETNSLDLQKAGWQAILDNFKKYVEK